VIAGARRFDRRVERQQIRLVGDPADRLVNNKQLDGSTAIPYTHAYAEITYRRRSGFGASLGADYTGANNWTNGPGFLLVNATAQQNVGHGMKLQFSVENLLDRQNGSVDAIDLAGGGFSQVTYGSPTAGGPASYGSSALPLYALPARTFRLQLTARTGR
jgi:hypothetical protein